MIEFNVSAPATITLIGEHAQIIKENKATVLAGSVDLRTTLKFAELSQEIIQIEFPCELGILSVKIPLEKLLNYFGHFGNGKFNSYRWHKKANLMDHFVRYKLEIPLLEEQVMKLKVILYLLISIAQREKIDIKPFLVQHVESDLPATSGESLGNTMSTTVCLAACFVHWARLQKNIRDTEFDTDHLEKISKYATECEDFIYTYNIMPGHDAHACTYGSIIEYHPERPVEAFANLPSFKILLVDTKEDDTIKTEVEKIYNLKTVYPAIANSIAANIEVVTESACRVFRDFPRNETNEAEYNRFVRNLHDKLGIYMACNQQLISILRISNSNLDKLSPFVTQQNQFMPFKYTHGDCGRYIFILLPLNAENQDIEDVSAKISRGMSCIITMVSLGCKGVRIE